ncbi:MAG: DUF1573 domain-containing protein [Bacteroidetes bacterium]|nr:DUF1573 domain-containing protein [Bacteroidota bacterium]
MKSIFPTCFLLVFIAWMQAGFVQAPVVSWKTETDHNFGQVRQGYPVKFTFQFTNITQEPVLLQTVRTTCGCTAAKWPESAILPGETGDILIEYDTYKSGDFEKKIRVFFDKQRKPEILWIRGSVD